MKSLFDSPGWGREQMGFTNDARVFDVAGKAANIEPSAGLSPRAVTAVFFGPSADIDGDHLVYIQHIQLFETPIAEHTLLDNTIQQLSAAIAIGQQEAHGAGVKLVDDPAGKKVHALSAAMKVPTPPTTQWAGAVVALHVVNALNVPRINLGAVRDLATCRHSINELFASASTIIQELRNTDINKELN
ncbi:hypothetical protein [Mycobacterium sp. NPDC050853]|uniref:hypothetical protein n=1 Tax=Mycobacterium sp. NPDC050853 TaxID=3155160 RepID=UPI0033CE7653